MASQSGTCGAPGPGSRCAGVTIKRSRRDVDYGLKSRRTREARAKVSRASNRADSLFLRFCHGFFLEQQLNV